MKTNKIEIFRYLLLLLLFTFLASCTKKNISCYDQNISYSKDFLDTRLLYKGKEFTGVMKCSNDSLKYYRKVHYKEGRKIRVKEYYDSLLTQKKSIMNFRYEEDGSSIGLIVAAWHPDGSPKVKDFKFKKKDITCWYYRNGSLQDSFVYKKNVYTSYSWDSLNRLTKVVSDSNNTVTTKYFDKRENLTKENIGQLDEEVTLYYPDKGKKMLKAKFTVRDQIDKYPPESIFVYKTDTFLENSIVGFYDTLGKPINCMDKKNIYKSPCNKFRVFIRNTDSVVVDSVPHRVMPHSPPGPRFFLQEQVYQDIFCWWL